MSGKKWGFLQTFAVIVFVILWALGAAALGITFASGGMLLSAEPTQAALLPPTPPPTATPSPTATSTATPSPAPTPFPPRTLVPETVPPTPTHTPTPTPRPTLPPPPTMPAPFPSFVPARETPEPATPIPTIVPTIPATDDTINILVLGSDRRPEWNEWHTDSIHLVSIQTDRAAVTVLSIPRDLYVYIPNYWMSRINFADYYGEAYGYPGGGPALLRDTLLYNLGVEIDHTVRTDFDGLIGIVDTLGGIDVPVHCRLSDYWPYPDENGEYPIFTLEPGIHHLDGEQALWYARSRKTTSTFSREFRQQQVLQAIWYRGRQLNMLPQLPSLWEQYRNMVVTDMTFGDVVELARVAFLVQDQNIRYYNIGRDAVTPWVTPNGGNVLLPNWEAIEPLMTEVLAPVPQERLNRTFTTVEVWNGTPNADWDALAADRLVRAGFPAVLGQPDRRDYGQSILVVYSEYAKGTGVGYLQQMFNIPDTRVIYAPDWNSAYGFRLVIGADYQTCFYR